MGSGRRPHGWSVLALMCDLRWLYTASHRRYSCRLAACKQASQSCNHTRHAGECICQC